MDDYNENVKKADEFKAALSDVVDTYTWSRARPSAFAGSGRFFANLRTFHRAHLHQVIDEFFDSEENEQVKDETIEAGSSTRPREVGIPNIHESTVNVSTSEQHRSNSEADSDCGGDDCLANKGRAQAESVMISPECDNSDAFASSPNCDNVSIKNERESEYENDSETDLEDNKVDLSAAGHVSEVTNNQEIDEAIISLLKQEKDQVDDNVAQMQFDAQQQATVPIAVNSENEQVDNSVDSNFENLNDSQSMDLNDEDTVNEQPDAEQIIDEAVVDEAFPTLNLVSLPSTSSGRQSTEVDSLVDYSTVNRNGKRTLPFAGKLFTPKPKPYICTWSGCDYSANQRGNVNTHVRIRHFGLPGTKKEQTERGIIDTRDAGEFIGKRSTN